jgi:hypothetical protein
MFYFLVSRILNKPAFMSKSQNKETQLRNIYIVGSICYIILHGFLYRKHAPDKIAKYRHYIYYMFLIDAILSGSYVYLFENNTDSANLLAECPVLKPLVISDNSGTACRQLTSVPEKEPVQVAPEVPVSKNIALEPEDDGTHIPYYSN